MKLQTQVPIATSLSQFGYHNHLLLLGSCFAENIEKKLSYYKFQSITNPFGIIFNPIALERLIEDAVLDKTYTEEDVFEFNGIWKSFVAHSDKNALSRLGAVIQLQEAQRQLREQLMASSHLFITLGTAWVYKHIAQNMVVANCHKVPQREFAKELLSVDEITQSLSKMLTLAKALNPKINITFTISPVRHLKDGFIENTRSKSHLLSAVHQLVDGEGVQYFPAYEMQMDELRDYRFYASDMIHPSAQAIDYIWERFVETYAFAKAQHTLKEVHTVQQGLSHKPLNKKSLKYEQFLEKLNVKKTKLEKNFPFMKF